MFYYSKKPEEAAAGCESGTTDVSQLAVNAVLDETNEIRLSCFDSIRREIAKRALLELIKDTRIQPSRIEEVVKQLNPRYFNRLTYRHLDPSTDPLAAQELESKYLPKTTMGKAISYFLNEYDALTGYLRDGRYEIDNNLVENAIRPTAVGRRRWLFIGHPEAGWRSAVIYSMVTSCRRRGINPQDYLTDVLARLPSMKINEIPSILPENWKPKIHQ